MLTPTIRSRVATFAALAVLLVAGLGCSLSPSKLISLLKPKSTDVPASGTPTPPPPATLLREESLLQTQPLTQGFAGWELWLQPGSNAAGENRVSMVDDTAHGKVVEFSRVCDQADGGAAGLIQKLDLDAASFESMHVRIVGKVLFEEGGNVANADPRWYPEGAVQVRVTYLTASGEEQEWYHGFYSGPVRGADGEHFSQAGQGEWFTYTSPNLMALPDPPTRITKFAVYGFGWQFTGQVAEVDLLAAK